MKAGGKQIFTGRFYKQTDFLAMGSSLCPVITNFFMEYFEDLALKWATHKSLCWFHYMDDTTVIWPHSPNRLRDYLNHLNSVHWNIQFTMEMVALWVIKCTINLSIPTFA
jgi:hypothetical protein